MGAGNPISSGKPDPGGGGGGGGGGGSLVPRLSPQKMGEERAWWHSQEKLSTSGASSSM